MCIKCMQFPRYVCTLGRNHRCLFLKPAGYMKSIPPILNHNFLYLFSPKGKKEATQLRISDFLVAQKDNYLVGFTYHCQINQVHVHSIFCHFEWSSLKMEGCSQCMGVKERGLQSFWNLCLHLLRGAWWSRCGLRQNDTRIERIAFAWHQYYNEL